LDGVETGKYVVTTSSGTQHFVDLDARTALRRGASGRESIPFIENPLEGYLSDGEPKILVTFRSDGTPFHFWSIRDATVGKQMKLDNRDEWRVTSEVKSIEVWDVDEDNKELLGDGTDGSAELDVPS
jgi:hypothetical protein